MDRLYPVHIMFHYKRSTFSRHILYNMDNTVDFSRYLFRRFILPYDYDKFNITINELATYDFDVLLARK